MKTLVLTNNLRALELARELDRLHGEVDVAQSPNGSLPNIPKFNVKKQFQDIAEKYQLILSIHCNQMFPAELVRAVRCVNVHSGWNPDNRGWYPQAFSIINGLRSGVTIHEMDEEMDHGPIIVQREYTLDSWDTSGTAYEKVMILERELVMEHFVTIRDGSYKAIPPCSEGNVNLKRDFDQLRQIDLNRVGRYGDLLNTLRAMTHGEYRNAYFVDATGRKVFVRVHLEPESD